MKMDIGGGIETPEVVDYQLKLHEVRNRLMRQGTAACESYPTTGPTGAAHYDPANLSDELFRRAPADFLARTSVETLERIVGETTRFYSKFVTGGKSYLVECRNHAESDERARFSSVYTAIGDRPFIVDTVSEFIRAQGLELYCVLHPILYREDGRRVSLMYIECDRIESPSKLSEFTLRLESRLDELLAVTDDFPSMLVRLETSARLLEGGLHVEGASPTELQEASAFLRWLADGGFVFLGFREWELDPKHPVKAAPTEETIVRGSNLGLFRTQDPKLSRELLDTNRDASYLLESNAVVLYSKILTESPIHRRVRMDVVTVRSASPDRKRPRVQCFLGLLTSRALAQEASSVPIIRQKLRKIMELEGVLPNSHDYKHIVSIVDSKPKYKLLRYDISTLRKDIALIMGISPGSGTRINLHVDPLRRFFLLVVVMETEKFSQAIRQEIQRYIESELHIPIGSSEYQISMTDDPYLRINFLLPNESLRDWPLDLDVVRNRIVEITTDWSDRVEALLAEEWGISAANRLIEYYTRLFPSDYRAVTPPFQTCKDIKHLERLSAENPLELSLGSSSHEANSYELRIYKRLAGLTLSQIVPLFENVDLEVVTEYTNFLGKPDSASAAIYQLRVRTRSGEAIDLHHAREHLLPNLKIVLTGKAENDRLNSLFASTQLGCREVSLLRTLLRYLWQIQGVSSRYLGASALVSNPYASSLLWETFRTKFDPDLFVGSGELRQRALEELATRFYASLRQVKMLAHDRFLRACKNVIDATVRTNFFQSDDPRDIALKIECALVHEMPKPRPMFEIFVNSRDFEGVHLRASRTARGGLRHSDRHEDFRTEVLGLMKTQIVKNSIIVPGGAKGGFVIKSVTPDSEPLPVKECYRRFIRSLLEVTDNISPTGEVLHPPRTIRYDQDDPYLVVAADKGTATFSDFANEIAKQEFGFWLGDAFASGGSNGYDHKKLGITARGAWETVVIRFRELGIDCENETYTVVGIGDMSGDVFGNGLLRSRKAKLIAAFNHKHIFLDPNPDPELSFRERERLFYLPGSQWSDYNPSLISPGGGVFNRTDKEIRLTPEARAALGVDEEVMSGEELIKAILCAPVDLLWNGGIGTYVKASYEDHVSVGDRSNDDVRVDALSLRAKVIGEGGNLGFTQLGRVEFAQRVGLINTDAVDNSGGVDMSDHEVNLKILLHGLVKQGELSEDESQSLLASLAETVANDVIAHNHSQSIALALDELRSRWHLTTFHAFVNELTVSRQFDRRTECIPTDDEFSNRLRHQMGLTRPELAVLLAHSKIALCDTILRSDITECEFVRSYLFRYFPAELRTRYGQYILEHPLRREITAAQIANALADLLGAVSVFRLAYETGAPEKDVIAAFVVASDILRLDELIAELRAAEAPGKMSAIYGALIGLSSAVEDLLGWLLVQRSRCIDWSEVLEMFREPLRQILDQPSASLSGFSTRHRFSISDLEAAHIDHELIRRISAITELVASLDIVTLAVALKAEIPVLLEVRRQLANALQIDDLLDRAAQIDGRDSWEDAALRSVLLELRQSLTAIVRTIVLEAAPPKLPAVGPYFEKRADLLRHYQRSLRELEGVDITLAALVVLSTQLRQLSALR